MKKVFLFFMSFLFLIFSVGCKLEINNKYEFLTDLQYSVHYTLQSSVGSIQNEEYIVVSTYKEYIEIFKNYDDINELKFEENFFEDKCLLLMYFQLPKKGNELSVNNISRLDNEINIDVEITLGYFTSFSTNTLIISLLKEEYYNVEKININKRIINGE